MTVREQDVPLNYAKTALLLGVLTGILVTMGGVVGGSTGLVVAFVAALVMNVMALWKSDQMVLRMQGAEEVSAQSAPEYYGLVQELAARAELPMPRVYVMHNPQPNAFATGRSPSSSAVCASTGLLEMLSREEVSGVLAHELAHIRNRDTLTMTVAATIGGAISMLAQWLQFSVLFGGRNRDGGSRMTALTAMIVAPFAAMIVQMAISRSREYQADRLGAMVCGNPLWLASALQRIQAAVRGIPNENVERAPAMAALFIINPLTGQGMDNLFSTHPNTENRVSELEKLAIEMGLNVAQRGIWDRPGIDGTTRNDTPQRTGPRGPWG
jgi:heat shock protein HtpX